MTTEYSQEYVSQQLALAEEALRDAQLLVANDRMRAAANRAYYAMFHAAHAGIVTVSEEIPRTHAGALNLFGRYLVSSGLIARRYSLYFRRAYRIRQVSDYSGGISIDDDQVREIVANAADFIEEVKRLIEQQDSE